MQFSELNKNRYSCRNYKDLKVSKEDCEKMIEAARISPSARNEQPCEFYCIQSEDKVIKMREAATKPGFNKFVSNVSTFIVIALTEESYKIKQEGIKKDFTDIDTGILTEAMCLEATSLGLATCILGSFDKDDVSQLVGINDPARLRLVVAVGVSNDESVPDKNLRRKKMEEVVKYL